MTKNINLDPQFLAELVREAVGIDTADYAAAFRRTVRTTARAMSTPRIIHDFNEVVRSYGRVPVAICCAATILDRSEHMTVESVSWALQVLACWPMYAAARQDAVICDMLPPTRIEVYAGNLIRSTSAR